MNIALLEPYFTGSHAAWARDYARYSRHRVQIFSLPGRFWKWRMHGGAVTLARRFLASGFRPDLLLATDMLDLTTFLALTRRQTGDIPAAIYFHENQLSYPWSPNDRDVRQNRDRHYGFINYASALAADAVFFNSRYHLDSFLAELHRFLKHFPDCNELETVPAIRQKARVLPLGLELTALDACRPASAGRTGKPALILWNHRWEYDKNPADFFRALEILAGQGLEFEVAVLGENFRQKPEEFLRAERSLGRRVVQMGYAASLAEYAAWLWQADLLPVTSVQDFFGISVMQAIYCHCYPLLPDRLAYPELIPADLHARHLYRDFDDLLQRLAAAITGIDAVRQYSLRHVAAAYRWEAMAPRYDAEFERVATGS